MVLPISHESLGSAHNLPEEKRTSKEPWWRPTSQASPGITQHTNQRGRPIKQLLLHMVCDIVGLLQESKRPLPRKLRKSPRRGSRGLSAPGSKKFKKSRKNLKRAENLKKKLEK